MPRGVVTPSFNFENMPRQNSALLQQIFEGIMALLNLEEETWSELLGLVGPERIRIKLTDLSSSCHHKTKIATDTYNSEFSFLG